MTAASVAGVAGACGAPAAAVQHLQATLRLALEGGSQEVAAVFTFGREEMIPRMFSALLSAPASCGAETSIFRYYLARHIQLDGGDHGPLAIRLVETLCGTDNTEAEVAAWARATAQTQSINWSLYKICLIDQDLVLFTSSVIVLFIPASFPS